MGLVKQHVDAAKACPERGVAAASASRGRSTLTGAVEESRSGQKKRNPCNERLVPGAIPFFSDCKNSL